MKTKMTDAMLRAVMNGVLTEMKVRLVIERPVPYIVRVSVDNDKGERLMVICEELLDVGSTLTLIDIGNAFNLTLRQE